MNCYPESTHLFIRIVESWRVSIFSKIWTVHKQINKIVMFTKSIQSFVGVFCWVIPKNFLPLQKASWFVECTLQNIFLIVTIQKGGFFSGLWGYLTILTKRQKIFLCLFNKKVIGGGPWHFLSTEFFKKI